MDIFTPETVIFLIGALGLLLLDFRLVGGRSLGFKGAFYSTFIWILASVLFGIYVWHFHGTVAGQEFFAGYAIEKILSVDNLVVLADIFLASLLTEVEQRKALAWGIVGAVVSRLVLISVGLAFVETYRILYLIFGIILGYKVLKMIMEVIKGKEGDHKDNFIIRFVKNRLHVSQFVLTIIIVEITDLTFATDSIPAVLSISPDPFVAFTSNVCAILGLRALYFLLLELIKKFVYLKPGLVFILGFIAMKLVLEYFEVEVSTLFSIIYVLFVLLSAILLSIIKAPKQEMSEVVVRSE